MTGIFSLILLSVLLYGLQVLHDVPFLAVHFTCILVHADSLSVPDTRISLLLHLTCTNTPSFFLPTLHQWRKRPCGSSRRIPLYIFHTFRRQGSFFLRVTACPWIRYIICVTVLLSTENRIEIHANSRRWHIANYQCSTCQKGFNCTRFLSASCILSWESNQELPKYVAGSVTDHQRRLVQECWFFISYITCLSI